MTHPQVRPDPALGLLQLYDVALPHAAPLPQLLAKVLEEGTVTVCSQCASRRDITDADTLEGIRIAGASTFLAEIMADGAQALVY